MLNLFFDFEDPGSYSSETSVDYYRTTWRYIPEDSHCSENLKSIVIN
jgi:hypothetical protein